jgi:hypothetical protein
MLPRTEHRGSVSYAAPRRNTLRSTHSRREPRPQLNLKLPAALIDSFRAFCVAHGLSQRAAIEAAILAFMGGVPDVASFSGNTVKPEEPEKLAESAPAPTPAEVTEMRDELAAVREAFPRMVGTGRPPNRADANNVLRWARRADPDAQPAEVAWFIRCRVDGGQRWRNWGGVVVAAGDYAVPHQIPAKCAPVATCSISFDEWLAGRVETAENREALWEQFMEAM